MKPLLIALVCLALMLTASAQTKSPDTAELNKMAARFSPTEMRVDLSKLSAGDRRALAKLVEAAKVVDDLFLTQHWSGNHALHNKLKRDRSPLGRARLHYFRINKAPWSELDGHAAFLPGVPPKKLPGSNFYPEDMTKEEFESWVKTLPKDQQELATGFFSVVRRDPQLRQPTCRGLCLPKLSLVPYSDAYKPQLVKLSALLREAAALTDNATLKKFLTTRADAFAKNDYYESDIAWMELDAPIDITIGPYETYADELFGYKAAFEAYIGLRDDAETAKIARFSQSLQELENNLPIDPQYRNPKIGALAPLRVVNIVFSAGDGNHGVQTAAYNLPNDEKVTAEKGAKRVMNKNTQQAKFEKTLVPISQRVLPAADQKYVEFETFFTHVLAHELVHGLGPQQIKLGDRVTSPRHELKNLYGRTEEAKADITGLFSLQYLHDKERGNAAFPDAYERRMYTTFLASAFRTLRFGMQDAHARGMALQFNYLLDKGGFVHNPDGTYSVDWQKIRSAVRDLTRDLLMLEATGDYAATQKMFEELSVIRPEMQKTLSTMTDLPTDIEPLFVTADSLGPASR